MRARPTAAVLVVALVVGSCSSGSSEPEVTTPSPGSTSSTAISAPAEAEIRVVTLNLLHGLFCPEETDSCQAPDRVAIFGDLVEDADCPDLIGLQEIGTRVEEVLIPAVANLCDGAYEVAWEAVDSPDRSMILTRLPIIDQGYLDLAAFPWEAYWVRVEADLGPVDLLTAHFASSANDPPCQADACPSLCEEGASTNECHAVEVVDLLDRRAAGAVVSIVSGDLNAAPGSPTVATLLDAGFVDAWLAAGQPECGPAGPVGCTGGGEEPEPFVGMDTEEGPGFDRRIDQVLVRSVAGCNTTIEAKGFATEPRAQPLDGMWWPSDHAGVEATIGCT